MGKITLYTGGARSGKSGAAQRAAMVCGDVAYVATAVNIDKEMDERIRRHVADRPAEWKTYECPYDIVSALAESSHNLYLIDCITVYVNNLIFEHTGHVPEGRVLTPGEQMDAERYVENRVDALIEAMRAKDADFIVVTNEVGMGVVPPSVLGRLFRDIAGRANQKLAGAADEVVLLVSGIPVTIKAHGREP